MTKHILLIVNPKSGTQKDKNKLPEIIQEELSAYKVKTYQTTGENDEKNINNLLDDLNPEIVIAAGGDGTINQISKPILKTQIPMGIIPLGSANGLANCLKIYEIEDTLQNIHKNNIINIDVLDINNKHCLHLSDFGFNAGLIKRFEKETRRGMLSYFKSSLEQLFEMTPYQFTIQSGNIDEEVECRLLIIANGDRYGTGAVINPTGKINDRRFEVIALNPDGFDEMLTVSYELFSEKIHESEHARIWSLEEVEIFNHNHADFHIDGEVMPLTEKISVKLHNEQLHIFGRQ
ncbi:MAG: diacylglycerol/lipid kinase family protein [Bacteroidales bacterium]